MREALLSIAAIVCIGCALWCERAVQRVRRAIHKAPETVRAAAADPDGVRAAREGGA